MAKESVKILQGKLDVESLISQLNAALAGILSVLDRCFGCRRCYASECTE